MALRIEDYALIGDCETAALVGLNGSIDWLCWPRFSSDACFAALLGKANNGRWQIAPKDPGSKSCRRYCDHTLVLETTFETKDGSVKVTDFMPPRASHSHVVRLVEGLSGRVAMRSELALRFNYGNVVPWVTHLGDGIRAIAGPDLVLLRSSEQCHGEDLTTVSEFDVVKGQRSWFTLTYSASYEPLPDTADPWAALGRTLDFWTEWASGSKYRGRYRAQVERSLITLKALTYRPTGGVVAAVTTSLPEQLGGPRNWDYRYCWLRDSTFTLLALMNGGFYDEAKAWREWLLRALAGSPDQVQIMYGISGERRLREWELDWLPGYEHSRPVRIGNAASEQVQLDIYGEVMDALFHAMHALDSYHPDDFNVQRSLIHHLEQVWRQPDQGIWEARSGAQQYTYSKMMAWVAFDRAILLAEHLGYDAPLDRWRKTRQAIHDEVCAKAYDPGQNAFTQHYGAPQLDSSLLLMPQVGFLPATDPRVVGTVHAIEKTLMRDGFLLRYDPGASSDGLPGEEGAFLACSFWLVSSLKLIGRERDAHALYERLLRLCNDVGLLSEEYDVKQKRLVGNFPQAFSHIALVNAAFDLDGEGPRKRRHRTHSPAAEKK